jgi:hypothetical protein
MTAETMHEIAYKIHYKSLAIPKLVAVAAFA